MLKNTLDQTCGRKALKLLKFEKNNLELNIESETLRYFY